MSREQAEAMLAIAAKHKKGVIGQEYLDEAYEVLNESQHRNA